MPTPTPATTRIAASDAPLQATPPRRAHVGEGRVFTRLGDVGELSWMPQLLEQLARAGLRRAGDLQLDRREARRHADDGSRRTEQAALDRLGAQSAQQHLALDGVGRQMDGREGVVGHGAIVAGKRPEPNKNDDAAGLPRG